MARPVYGNLGVEESQAQVIERLFIIPAAQPESRANQKDCLNRLQELFNRDSFDKDCAEFHFHYHEAGLDFAKCWVSLHYPKEDWMGAYNKIIDEHHLAPANVLRTRG